jgi:hypothetical protein
MLCLMAKLSAASVASFYTAEQIAAKISEYQALLDAAAQGGYRLDTTQGNQSATPPDPDRVGELLEVYLKAYRIKTGTQYARMIHTDFRPTGGFAR